MMDRMRVYISGPISGKPNQNREAFESAASMLLRHKFVPVNPICIPPTHKYGTPCTGNVVQRHPDDPISITDRHRYGCYMKADIRELLDCDAIMLLRGWNDSEGANTEVAVAQSCGIPFLRVERATALGSDQFVFMLSSSPNLITPWATSTV